MRQLWLLILVVCAGLQGQASAQTFNERYDPWGRADFGWSIETLSDSSYIVFSNSAFQDSLFYSSVLTGVRLNEMGEVLDTTRLSYPLRATYAGWANASDQRSAGGFVVGGNTYQADETIQAAIFATGPDGHISILMEYGDPGEEWIGRQVKQTPDGGYVLCGETSTVGFLDAFVLKTDPIGTVQWVKTYGGPYTDRATSVAMDPAIGGYFAGGKYRETGSNDQLWVQSMNDTGAVLWSKIWGGEFDEFQAHITTLEDGHILVASNWGTAVGNSVMYLAKLDRVDGSVIWSSTYGEQCQGCVLLVGQEVWPSGDLIATGITLVSGGSYFGSLLRTTSEGDSLWMRNYQYFDDSISNGRGLFYDVQPTHDGGFIAVGVALSVAGNYGQDLWVVKTDSMGCIVPGCHLVTGVGTQITNLKDVLRVWPNPAASGGSIQLEINLPEGFIAQGALRLTVVNSLGQVVHEQPIAPHAGQVSLSFAGRWGSAGLYHLHLSDATRWIGGTELVVE